METVSAATGQMNFLVLEDVFLHVIIGEATGPTTVGQTVGILPKDGKN